MLHLSMRISRLMKTVLAAHYFRRNRFNGFSSVDIEKKSFILKIIQYVNLICDTEYVINAFPIGHKSRVENLV